MEWLYKNKPVDEDTISGYWGFVYLITNNQNGKKYIGKKQFNFIRRKKVKDRKNRKVVIKESDWATYYGSNDIFNEDVKTMGEDNFTREILHLCTNKTECSYLEAYEQFTRHVLLDDNYYNSWISVRIQKTGLKKYAEARET